MNKKKIAVQDLIGKKHRGEKITMLTAYDYSTAMIVERAGIDAILVGDSLGMVVLGYQSTRDVTMEDMIRHAAAVRRGADSSLVIGDMPYLSYDTPKRAVENATRFVKEAGCDAVKLEGESYEATSSIIKAGIPVLGHLGLTPQTAEAFRVQGKDSETAGNILQAAERLQDARCFGIVLECMPAELSRMVTSRLQIPTIGIGAGPDCDGQVLVINDMLGLFDRFRPKFVKQYAHMAKAAQEAVLSFKEDVEAGKFPADEHSYRMKAEELSKLKGYAR